MATRSTSWPHVVTCCYMKAESVRVRVSVEEKELWRQAAPAGNISWWLRDLAEAALAERGGDVAATPTQSGASPEGNDGGHSPRSASARALPEHRADPKDKASMEKAPREKKARGMCEHRVALGSYCKRCEANG